MYARYQKGKRIVLIFDLEHGKEVGCAFTFFHGGINATPFTTPLKEQMDGVLDALKEDVIEKVRSDEEVKNFQLCIRCATEIDLRSGGWGNGGDGLYYHLTCPKLKPPANRDI